MLLHISPNALLFFLPLVSAVVTNRTIDDTAGDLITGVKPIYVPPTWQGPYCVGCSIKPPLDDVFLKTYSALTYWPEEFPKMSIEFSFQGTAVYVYFILANYVGGGITTETMCNFTLDGQYVSTFHHLPTQSTDYEFNALVFSQDGLSNGKHTLLISTSGINRHLFTSFDYAQYTFDDSITSAIQPTASSVASQGSRTVTSTQSTTQSITQSTTLSTTQSTDHSIIPAITSPSPSLLSQTSPTVTDTPPAAQSTAESTKPNTSAPIATIVGGVIGGLLIFLIALLTFCRFRRWKHASLASARVVSTNESFYVGGLSPLRLRPGTVIPPWLSTNPSHYSGQPPLPPFHVNDTSTETTSDSTEKKEGYIRWI
ncbi:hypothetical protein H0H93_007687 [Arthromyces matolae]|nr:hypothetical protein H0H93_007687 [Arthromyces matolae]